MGRARQFVVRLAGVEIGAATLASGETVFNGRQAWTACKAADALGSAARYQQGPSGMDGAWRGGIEGAPREWEDDPVSLPDLVHLLDRAQPTLYGEVLK